MVYCPYESVCGCDYKGSNVLKRLRTGDTPLTDDKLGKVIKDLSSHNSGKSPELNAGECEQFL